MRRAATEIASTAAQVAQLAAAAGTLPVLDGQISECRACPRLVAWREEVARVKRRAFADQTYWGRPVPGFGADAPRILIVGLAPAAHGANRTGRNFTGDRSGDWLYASLYRVGLANQPTSVSADDGLALRGTYIAAAVRCAAPGNAPTPVERDTCRPWLEREIELLWPRFEAVGLDVPPKGPAFGHGVEVSVEGRAVIGCYHVSQQNTFTGRLTEPMLDG